MERDTVPMRVLVALLDDRVATPAPIPAAVLSRTISASVQKPSRLHRAALAAVRRIRSLPLDAIAIRVLPPLHDDCRTRLLIADDTHAVHSRQRLLRCCSATSTDVDKTHACPSVFRHATSRCGLDVRLR